MDCFFTAVPLRAQDAPALPRVHARGAPRARRAAGHGRIRWTSSGERIARALPADLLRRVPRRRHHRRDDPAPPARRAVRQRRRLRHDLELPAGRPVPERPAPRPHPAGDRAAQRASSRWSASTTASTTGAARWSRSSSTTRRSGRQADAADERGLRRAWPKRATKTRCCTSSSARSARGAGPAAWSGSTSRRCAAARARRTTTSRSRTQFHTVLLSDVPQMSPRLASRGAPLHLAGRRAVRPPGQADHVGRGAARGAVHRRAAGARVSAHRLAAAARCSRPSSWRWSGATSTPR